MAKTDWLKPTLTKTEEKNNTKIEKITNKTSGWAKKRI